MYTLSLKLKWVQQDHHWFALFKRPSKPGTHLLHTFLGEMYPAI